MRRFVIFTLLVLFSLAVLPTTVFATSDTAYSDYLFQYDIYRQNLTDFKVSKNEYDKFKTLESQTTLLSKTKIFLSQRDHLLRAYLFLLNEKLNEDKGLSQTERSLYQRLIQSEVVFLDNHSQLVPSVGSLGDADAVSKQLESHYQILSASTRQTIVAIILGKLFVERNNFDSTFAKAQILVNTNRNNFTPSKQATLERWVLQIINKRNLFQQKIDLIISKNAALKPGTIQALDSKLADLQKDLAEARLYLVEATSFLGELVNNVRFVD